ncbi:MAG: outer membrane lipoprotein chaperone LolA [Granulosicoccaceae bacterium]
MNNTFFNVPAIALLIVMSVFTQPGIAADNDEVLSRLRSFVSDVTSFSADFSQTLYNADGEVVKSDAGTVFLKRPGQLIWRYEGEGAQEIIADGKNIWLHDKELQQVTVNPLDERVNGTPMVVLMGTGELEEQFEMTVLSHADGIDWIKLVPREAGADFDALFIGLTGTALAAMELRDSFGQATQIRFSDFQPNIKISDDDFQFIPPAGVDVIGEPLN